MPTALMPEGRQRYYNNDGTPCAGGLLYTYAAGTSAPKTTYADEAGTTPNTNPVALDAHGEAVIYWSGAYKVNLQQADGQQVTGYPVDNLKTDPAGIWATITTLAQSAGAALIGFIQAGVGAVARTLQDKARERVSVADFGAKCDGVADDGPAILRGVAYLKSIGGGELYFPGRSLIKNTLFLSGSIAGGSSGYPVPTLPKITFVGNGESGIISNIAAGDVIRFSSPAETLNFTVGFRNFLLDCLGNNVTAINGTAQAGIYGANHYTDIDGLKICGIAGAAAVGIDFGTITDSKVCRMSVQGSGAGANIGYRLCKADVRLVDCYAVYCARGISVQGLAEAAVLMFGGGTLHCQYSIYWEPTGAFTYSSASLISGAFLGETTSGEAILGAASPGNLDVGSVAFIGCSFDSYRPGQDLMTVNFGGRFTFIGNNLYYASTGNNTVDLGQYAVTTWAGNTNMTVKPGCQALVLQKVNNFGTSKAVLDFYGTAIAGAAGNALLNKDASLVTDFVMPFAGSLIGIGVQANAALTGGSIDVQLEVNHGGVGGATATLGTGAATATRTIASGAYTFNAGDRVGVRYYKNGVITPAPFDLSVQLVVQF